MNKAVSAPDIRLRNIRSVFELARRNGEVLRPEISRYTGLTPPTVMKVVQQLIQRKILIEAGEVETALGRKPVRLLFNSSAAAAVGIVFEGDNIHAGIVDLAGNVLLSKRQPMKHAFDLNIAKTIAASTMELVENIDIPILGVGLAVPGVVDARRKKIILAPLIGISEPFDCVQVCAEIVENTGHQVFLENDVNATASGEFFIRRMSQTEDLLYVSIGTGIGAGIILNGSLRKGSRNVAGELGYAVQNASYQVDRTRPGWLESQIGLDSLKRQFNWMGYEKNHIIPEGLISYVSDHLAPPIANLATQLDIRTIVLGGLALDTFGEKLFEALSEKIHKLSLLDGEVQLSSCDEPGIVGAAVLAIDQQMDQWLGEEH